MRTRAVIAVQVRSYLAKAEEYLAAAKSELAQGRSIAATSLAIHAASNAADVVTGVRLGRRAAGQGHEEVLSLFLEAGHYGAEAARDGGTGPSDPPSTMPLLAADSVAAIVTKHRPTTARRLATPRG